MGLTSIKYQRQYHILTYTHRCFTLPNTTTNPVKRFISAHMIGPGDVNDPNFDPMLALTNHYLPNIYAFFKFNIKLSVDLTKSFFVFHQALLLTANNISIPIKRTGTHAVLHTEGSAWPLSFKELLNPSTVIKPNDANAFTPKKTIVEQKLKNLLHIIATNEWSDSNYGGQQIKCFFKESFPAFHQSTPASL